MSEVRSVVYRVGSVSGVRYAPSDCTVKLEVLPGVNGPVEGYAVHPVWGGVDRPDTGGWVVKSAKLAERLRKAVMAGAVFSECKVAKDVNGKTYMATNSLVMAKYANADLKRLGF